MRRWIFVVVAVGACKKDASEQIEAARAAPEADKPKLYCELAKKAGDSDVNSALASRLITLAYVDVGADAPITDDLECIPKALGALKTPPDLKAEITRLHFKRPKAAAVAAYYEALPDKKEAVLDAFANFGAHWVDWHVSAPHAAPAMLAEIDKLGAAADPRFYVGLVGAYAYGDKLPPAIKERYAKLGADPKINDAWVTAMKGEDARASEGSYTEGYVRVVEIGLHELETRTGKLPIEVSSAVIRACGQPAANCTTSGKLDDESKKLLGYSMQSNDNYDWSPKARMFVMTVQGGKPPDPVALLFADLEAGQQASERQKRDNSQWREEAPGTTDLTRDDPVAWNFKKTVEALVAVGPSAVPALLEAVKMGPFVRGRAAARALAKIDPTVLAKAADEALAFHEKLTMPVREYSSGLGNALAALREAPGDEVTNLYLRLLSSTDPALSGYATATLKKRLQRDQAVDALFRYMAAKDKYAQYEIDRYVDLVTSYGKEASPAIVKNLEALLATAGAPEKVFWAHKVVAMMALQQVGTRAAATIVGKYLSDPGGYTETKTPVDEEGKPKGPVQATPRTFKDLAEKTLAKLS